jgi:hypothetical protein
VTRVPVSLALAALVAVAFFVGPNAAAAKEGVVARVLTPIARDARPGTAITIVWTLSYVDETRTRRPFGSAAIFVRLLGPDGSRSPRVYGAEVRRGRFRATVRIPRGGVRKLEIGVMGTRCAARCRSAPAHFPIVGDPFR